MRNSRYQWNGNWAIQLLSKSNIIKWLSPEDRIYLTCYLPNAVIMTAYLPLALNQKIHAIANGTQHYFKLIIKNHIPCPENIAAVILQVQHIDKPKLNFNFTKNQPRSAGSCLHYFTLHLQKYMPWKKKCDRLEPYSHIHWHRRAVF
mgnify:CR=1 FL=1